MRFLIDECLSPRLAVLARDLGHHADHVTWLGLGGTTDRGLMPIVREGDYAFVTNNAADFRRLYAREDLHAGLIIIVPNVPGNQQRDIFSAFLEAYGAADLVNAAVEIELEGDELFFREYNLP